MRERGELIETPQAVGTVSRIRWVTGQRSRALIPAGLAPRLLLHLSDECLYRADGQIQEVRPGDMLFDGGATTCERQISGFVAGEIEQVHIPENLTDAPATQQTWQRTFGGIFPNGNASDNAVLDWHSRRVLQALATTPPQTAGARLEVEAGVRQATIAVLEPLTIRSGQPRTSEAQRLHHLEALAEARQFMATRFTDDRYRLAQAADAASLTEAHFSQLFHRLTGLTAQDYIMRLRIEHARLLLAHSEMSIGDACYESGFRHLSHFAATFARVTGSTPSAWRQKETTRQIRCPAIALGAMLAERTPSPATSRAMPLYIRRGSALYLTHLALSNIGTANTEVLNIFRPFLNRPERRNRAIQLIGLICDGTGPAGIEAIRRVFQGVEMAEALMPMPFGDALRGRPFTEVEAVLGPCLKPAGNSIDTRLAAIKALAIALRDTADERVLQWLPQFFRTGDGRIDNRGVSTLGSIFRGSGNRRIIALLAGCLTEGMACPLHDHALSPACVCNSSDSLALVGRGTPAADDAAAAIRRLLETGIIHHVYDAQNALAILYRGQAPDGLTDLLPHTIEGRFENLLELFDSAVPQRALPAIEALWSHPSTMIRRTMAFALGMVYQGTADAHALRLLEQNVRRAAPKLRGDSLLALGLVQHRRADGELLALASASVRSPQPYLTRSALLAVGLGLQGSGDSDAIAWAAGFATDGNRYVAAAAIWCLGLLGQGTRDGDLANMIQDLCQGNRRLNNDADQALLMLDFDLPALVHLTHWDGHFPKGEYASSFNYTLRHFSRAPGVKWDIDLPRPGI